MEVNWRSCGSDWVVLKLMNTSGSLQVMQRSYIGHCTFGTAVQKDFDVGRGDVSFLLHVPPYSGPAVSFVLLHHRQQLSLHHGQSAFVLTCSSYRNTAHLEALVQWRTAPPTDEWTQWHRLSNFSVAIHFKKVDFCCANGLNWSVIQNLWNN